MKYYNITNRGYIVTGYSIFRIFMVIFKVMLLTVLMLQNTACYYYHKGVNDALLAADINIREILVSDLGDVAIHYSNSSGKEYWLTACRDVFIRSLSDKEGNLISAFSNVPYFTFLHGDVNNNLVSDYGWEKSFVNNSTGGLVIPDNAPETYKHVKVHNNVVMGDASIIYYTGRKSVIVDISLRDSKPVCYVTVASWIILDIVTLPIQIIILPII